MQADPQLKIRLPPDVKAFVAMEAERNACSQTSEIVRAIRERMERTKAATGGEFGDLTPAADQNRSALPGALATHG